MKPFIFHGKSFQTRNPLYNVRPTAKVIWIMEAFATVSKLEQTKLNVITKFNPCKLRVQFVFGLRAKAFLQSDKSDAYFVRDARDICGSIFRCPVWDEPMH